MAPVEEKPSLQRLLALDKTFETLDDRIEAAAEILGLSLSGENVNSPSTGNYGRHDLVFRWISDKLKKDATARANPRSWTLLRQLLVSLPGTKVPKLLANASIVPAIVAALAEHHTSKPDQINGEALPPTTTTKKKRKRSEALETSNDTGHAHYAFFLEISKLLHTIKIPCTNHQVAEIAKLWFHALETHLTSQAELEICYEVQFIQEIWANASRTSIKQEADINFATEVAWPALRLVSEAHTLSLLNLETLLKNLIRTELLQPAHDDFLRSALSTSRSSITDGIPDRFETFTEQITSYLKDSKSHGTGDKVSIICNLLAVLFEFCNELKEHHSPREKRAHGRWIEALFSRLSTAIGQLPADTIPDDSRKKLIMSMLDHIQADTLSGPVLEQIVLDVSGLSINSAAHEADFAVIARVLALDPSIFHPTQKHKDLGLQNLLRKINTASSRMAGIKADDAQLWVHSLAIPLVNAQIHRLRADRFLEEWSTAMNEYESSSVDSWCIWQHPAVREILSDLIEKAASPPALRKTLDTAKEEFTSSLSQTSKSSAKSQGRLACNLLRLAILIDCIGSDALVDELHEDFESILGTLRDGLPNLRDKKVSRMHFWELLTRLHDRLYPDTDHEAGTTRIAKLLLKETACAEDAIACLTKEKKSRPISLQGIASALSYILQRLELLGSECPEDNAVADMLQAVAVKYPEIVASVLCGFPNALKYWKAEATFPVHKQLLKQFTLQKDASGPLHKKLIDQYLELVVRKVHGLTGEQRDELVRYTSTSDNCDETVLNGESDRGAEIQIEEKIKDLGVSLESSEKALLDVKTIIDNELDLKSRHGLEQNLHKTMSTKLAITHYVPTICKLLTNGKIEGVGFASLLIGILPSGIPSEPSEVFAGRTIMPALLDVLGSTEDNTVSAALQMLKTILAHKRWLINQYIVEEVLASLHKLLSPSARLKTANKSSAVYDQVCAVVQLVLQFHRTSLGGRLHLLMPVLNQLLACLFVQSKNTSSSAAQFQRKFRQPPWLVSDTKRRLTQKQGQYFARLITLLCNPPQSTVPGYRAGSDQPRLTDVVREARVHVSEFVPVLLHAYCHFQLHGVVTEGVKVVLAPAIHAIFDVMDMAAAEDERVIALGASMGKPELALLRKEHGEWKRFGRWKGG